MVDKVIVAKPSLVSTTDSSKEILLPPFSPFPSFHVTNTRRKRGIYRPLYHRVRVLRIHSEVNPPRHTAHRIRHTIPGWPPPPTTPNPAAIPAHHHRSPTASTSSRTATGKYRTGPKLSGKQVISHLVLFTRTMVVSYVVPRHFPLVPSQLSSKPPPPHPVSPLPLSTTLAHVPTTSAQYSPRPSS